MHDTTDMLTQMLRCRRWDISAERLSGMVTGIVGTEVGCQTGTLKQKAGASLIHLYSVSQPADQAIRPTGPRLKHGVEG